MLHVPSRQASSRRKSEPKVVQRLHLLNGRVLSEVRPRRGETIRSFHRRATSVGSCAGMRTIVTERVNGELVPVLMKDWHRRIGVRIELVLVSAPGDGGGGGGTSASIGGIIGLLALTAFAPIAAGAIAGAAFGGAGASLISALIIGGGSLLLSHFMSAKKGAKSSIPEYSINIRTNEARSQQPIPVPYGRLKRFPDLAASQWSDFQGSNQIFHAIYSIGCGYHQIHEIGIGDTMIWSETTGTVAGYAGSLRLQFMDPNQDCDLFPVDVYSSPSVSGQQLPDVYGATDNFGDVNFGPNGETAGYQYIGPFSCNPPGSKTNRLAIDFVAPGGIYYVNSKGNQKYVDVGLRFEIQAIDDQGHTLGGWMTVYTDTLHRSTKDPIRETHWIDVPQGRYQGRFSRTTAIRHDGAVDTVNWVGMRAYLIGPNAVPYASRMALEIVADRLLSAASSEQVYVIATRKIPVYDPSSGFSLQPSTNPIWAALDVYNNPDYGGNLPYDDVDIQTLLQLAQVADSRGEQFNYMFTSQISIYDAISTCLRVSQCQPAFFFNKFSAIRDQNRGIPKVLFTDAQIVQGSVEIQYILKDTTTSDGVIVEYVDSSTWQQEEVTSRQEGVVPLQPSRVQIPGVTERQQATILARKLAADNEYRRTTLSFETESEAMMLSRGDLILVQSELPMSWGALCYVDSVDVPNAVVTTNIDQIWDDASTHFLRIRKKDGGIFGPIPCIRGNSDREIIMSQPAVAAAQQTQGLLADALYRDDLQQPVTMQFSPSQMTGFFGLIKTIEAGSDEGRFKITCVNDAPEVYQIDGSAVEPLPSPPALAIPPAPSNQFYHVNAYIYQQGTSMTLVASWDPDPGSSRYQARISYDRQSWSNIYEGQVPSFNRPGLSPNDLYLQFRGINTAGLQGAWNEVFVVCPILVLNPASLGMGIGFDDLLPSLYANTTAVPLTALTDLFSATLQSVAAGKYQQLSLSQEVATAKASVDELTYVLATTTEAIAGRVLTIDASLASNAASIKQEIQARAEADAATATVLTTLTASVAANTASITQEIQARADADAATASVLTTLTSTVAGNTASITQEIQTRADADKAMATSITQLQVQVASNSASIITEQQVRADRDTAIALSVTSLQTTVGSNTASISTLQASVNGVLVQYGVIGTINGQTGGFIFEGVQRLDGSAYFATYFKGDLIVDGTIQARNIANGAITAFAAASGLSYDASAPTTGYITAAISIDQPANVLIDFSVITKSSGTGGQTLVDASLFADGTQVFQDQILQVESASIKILVPCRQIVSLPAGTHIIKATAQLRTAASAASFGNGYLIVEAFKR